MYLKLIFCNPSLAHLLSWMESKLLSYSWGLHFTQNLVGPGHRLLSGHHKCGWGPVHTFHHTNMGLPPKGDNCYPRERQWHEWEYKTGAEKHIYTVNVIKLEKETGQGRVIHLGEVSRATWLTAVSPKGLAMGRQTWSQWRVSWFGHRVSLVKLLSISLYFIICYIGITRVYAKWTC